MYTPEQRDTAVELYRRGNSLRTCAKAIGCSHGIVRKWVSETDVPVRRYGAHVYPEDIREEILKAHREGFSLRDIKRGFGCSPQTVMSWEKKKPAPERALGSGKAKNSLTQWYYTTEREICQDDQNNQP